MRRNRFGRWVAAAALAAAGFGGAGGAMAQEAPRVITYDEAIGIALRQNVAVRIAENAVELRSLDVRQQKLGFLPNLQLSTQAGGSSGRSFQEDVGAIVTETTQSLNVGISSSVTLFDGFRNVAELRGAQLTEAASELDLARAQETAVMTVAQNFLSLVSAQEQVRVREEALAAQESELALVQAAVDAGSRPIADLYQQQASVASARAALVEARRNAELAELDIIGTLQLDPAVEYAFSAPDVEESGAAASDLAELIARALAGRADLRAGDAREDAAEQDVRAAAGAWLPTVSLSAGYSTRANSASELGWADQFDQGQGGSLSLGVSIPIFDRGQASAQKEAAEIQLEQTRMQLDQQRQEVALEVRRAWLGEQAAAEQLEAAQAQLVAAERALEATRERYRVGAATLTEVAQSRSAQVQAASDLVTARYTLVLQRTLMDYYVGALGTEQAPDLG